jgi:DNA-binding response OmpR family regulator
MSGATGGASGGEGKRRILVVEDDLAILTGLSMNLTFEGYEVLQAQDGREGLRKALDAEPDLVVLDVMLPELNGFELLRELRGRGSLVPVVMLTAKGTEQDKIVGLDLGADDYVTKPFGLQELLARIKAVLRRRFGGVAGPAAEGAGVTFGDVRVDLAAKVATRGGAAVELTAQEFKLLAHLVTHPGRTFSREELLARAWSFDYEGSPRTVDNFMRQLRQKFEPDPDAPRYFVTARGLGYRFEAP